MKFINYLALTLIIIGALNWLLIGAFEFNLVETLFGGIFNNIKNNIYTSWYFWTLGN